MALILQWFVEPGLLSLARSLAASGRVEPGFSGLLARSSDEQFTNLLSGDVDAVVTAMDNVMDWNLRSSAGDFRIIAQVEKTTSLSLVGSQDLVDLEGFVGGHLLVDAPTNGFVVAALAMLATRGLDRTAYAIEPVGGVKERCEALLQRRQSATLLGPPFDSMAIAKGAHLLARVNDCYPSFPGQGLVVQRSRFEANRDALADFVGRLEQARYVAATDPENSVEQMVSAAIPRAQAEVFADLLPISLVPDRDGVNLLISQRRLAGLPGGGVTYGDVVDASLLKEIR